MTWIGAFRSEVAIRDFDLIASDEPAGLGGAPNPVEQVLGYQAYDTLSYLRERVPRLRAHMARMRVDVAAPSTAPTDRAAARGDTTVDPDR